MSVIDVTEEGFALVETAEGVSASEVAAATDAPLQVPGAPLPTF